MHVVIPCKSFDAGKSRLSGCLYASARRELCKELYLRTLKLATAIVSPSRIRVLTADEEAIAIANRLSISHVADPGNGLNEGLEAARAVLMLQRDIEQGMLVLPIDLTFADPAAISSFSLKEGDVVIAPDEVQIGTNLLLLRRAAVKRFSFLYGTRSYEAHLADARRHGLSTETMNDWRLAFDLDGPSQYSKWRVHEQRSLAGPH